MKRKRISRPFTAFLALVLLSTLILSVASAEPLIMRLSPDEGARISGADVEKDIGVGGMQISKTYSGNGDIEFECPFEDADARLVDNSPLEEKITEIHENLLKICDPFSELDEIKFWYGEGIALRIGNIISYSSTQYTEPSTDWDMQLQTGLQKKDGVNWNLVTYKPAIRATTDELSQSGFYSASAGTYRTVGCHKVWFDGELVIHIDSYSGELTIY